MSLSYHYMLMANHVILQKKIISFTERYRINVRPAKGSGFSTGKRRSCPERDRCSLSYRTGFSYHHPQRHGGKRTDPEKKSEREPAFLAYFPDRPGKGDGGSRGQGFEELEDQAFSGISVEEQESFLKTFEKIYHNMKTLEEKKHDRKN